MKEKMSLHTRNLRVQRTRHALPHRAILLMLLLWWQRSYGFSKLSFQVSGFIRSKIANQKRKKWENILRLVYVTKRSRSNSVHDIKKLAPAADSPSSSVWYQSCSSSSPSSLYYWQLIVGGKFKIFSIQYNINRYNSSSVIILSS